MVNFIKKNFIIILIFIFGTLLRFINLSKIPVWIDEVLLYQFSLVAPNQEFISWLFGQVLPYSDPFWLRFPSALFGSLTILIPFIITSNKKNAELASAFIAFFPLFVFWSRMARPYAISGFFIGLSFKWFWLHYIALLNTPWAITGFDFTTLKNKGIIYITISVILTGIFISIRPDNGRDFLNYDFLIHAKRMWVIPFYSIVFHVLKVLDIKENKLD